MLLVTAGFCLLSCGDDDDDGLAGSERVKAEVEAEIADDLEGLADALAAGNYERVYDDFVTESCQARVPRDEYVRLLRENEDRSGDLRVELEGVELLSQSSPEQAEVRVDFNLVSDGMAVPRDPDAAPEIRNLVLESGHWRDSECLGLQGSVGEGKALL